MNFLSMKVRKEYRKILADQISQKLKLLYRFVNEILSMTIPVIFHSSSLILTFLTYQEWAFRIFRSTVFLKQFINKVTII